MIDARTGRNCRNCCSAAAGSPAANNLCASLTTSPARRSVLALLLNPFELDGELLLRGLHEGVRRCAFQQRERIFDAAGARQTLRPNHDVAGVTLGRAAGPLFECRCGVRLQTLGALVLRLDRQGGVAGANDLLVFAGIEMRLGLLEGPLESRRAFAFLTPCFLCLLDRALERERGVRVRHDDARLIEEAGGSSDRTTAQFVLPLRQPPFRLPFIKAEAGLLEHLRRALEIRIHQQRPFARRDHLFVVRRGECGGRFLQVQLDLSFAAFAELARGSAATRSPYRCLLVDHDRGFIRGRGHLQVGDAN